jgi:outer membrane protein
LYGRQNSIDIKRAQNSIIQAELGEQQAKHNRYPNLRASVGGGYQFGRTIDPTTNSFNNTQIGFNSYTISAGAVVFNGNRVNNQVKLARLDVSASQLDAEFISDNLSLNIATGYLNVLLAQEQLELVRKRLEQSQQQLEQTDKLIQAGSLPENDRLDIVSQIALDEQSIVDAENQLSLAYLNLRQIMLLDPREDFQILRPEIVVPEDIDPDEFSVNEIYVTAMNNQANIKANELRMQQAQLQVENAKADFLPQLTVFGNINTNYSTAAPRFSFVPTRSSRTFFVDGEPVTFEFDDFMRVQEDYPYADQLSENLGQSLGATISIPIYNNYTAKINKETARLGVITQELTNREAEQTLRANIARAVADARAAKRSLDAAQLAVNAAQTAYENAQRRFDLGAINSLEFSTARLNLDQAQISLLRARYQYIFNLKQIDFYQGRTITLN